MSRGWRWEAVEVVPTEAGFRLKWQEEIPVGELVVVEGFDLVEVRDGLIVRNEVCFDRAGWMVARAER